MSAVDELPEMGPDEALAADYALGALSGPERREAERRAARDPAFRALVAAWQADLAPLLEEVAEVAPPAPLWHRIAAAVDPRIPAVPASPVQSTLWNSLAFWRTAATGFAAAAGVALVLLLARPEAPPATLLVATLASPEGAPLITAAYDAERRAIILAPATPRIDPDHAAELWVIEGGRPPRSLGLIDLANPRQQVVPAERLAGLQPGATLAISIEPPGGSPTGAPTGPVVATGTLKAI